MEPISEKILTATTQIAQVLHRHLLPRFRTLKFQGQISWSEFKKEIDSFAPEASNLVESTIYLGDAFRMVTQMLKTDGFDVLELSVDSNIYSKRQIHYSARLRSFSLARKISAGFLAVTVLLTLVSVLPAVLSDRSMMIIQDD